MYNTEVVYTTTLDGVSETVDARAKTTIMAYSSSGMMEMVENRLDIQVHTMDNYEIENRHTMDNHGDGRHNKCTQWMGWRLVENRLHIQVREMDNDGDRHIESSSLLLYHFFWL